MGAFIPQTKYRGFQSLQHPLGFPAWWLGIPVDPTNWCACGVFSIHHALVSIGYASSEGDLKRLHGRLLDLTGDLGDGGGLVLNQLSILAKKAGCRTEKAVARTRRSMRGFISRHLDAGNPVIVGSEPECHWMCLIGKSGDGAWVTADSSDWPTVNRYEVESIIEWTGLPEDHVELAAIIPADGRRIPRSRSLVRHVGGVWERWHHDPAYAAEWCNLLDDMLHVFWDHDMAPSGLAAEVFFDEYGPQVVDIVGELTASDKFAVAQQMEAYRNVAVFHSLVAAKGHVAQCIAGLSLVLQARLT